MALPEFIRNVTQKFARAESPPRAESTREIWSRTWFALNELAGHATLIIAIMLVMVGLSYANHELNGPQGIMIVNGPSWFKLPLDWFFTLVDASALSRLAWAGFKIFRHL